MSYLDLAGRPGSNQKKKKLPERDAIVRKLLWIAGLGILPSINLTAQVTWQKLDSSFGSLPESIHVYSTHDSLDGAPFLAYYASIKLRDKSINFSVLSGDGARFTASQFYYQQSRAPALLVNGPYFSYQTGQSLSLVIQNGKMIALPVAKLKGRDIDSGLYYYPTRAALGINRNRKADIAWVFADPQRARPYAFSNGPVIAKGKEDMPTIYDLGDINWVWWEMRTAIGGGPMLIYDGKIRITSGEEQMYPGTENEKAPRTAMGYTADNRLIILVIQGRSLEQSDGATLLQTANLLKNLGCLRALNFDGGGSSCMLVNGKETIHPSDKGGQRPLPYVFVVKAAE